MKTKKNDWVDTKTLDQKFGFDVFVDGQWKHAAENGVPCLFATPAERDAKRKEFQKRAIRSVVRTVGA